MMTRKINYLIFLVAILTLLIFQFQTKSQSLKVEVEIDFGQNSEKQKHFVEKEKSITALEALQLISNVETKVGKGYVIVISVNNVKSEPGKTAWYYKVNGKMANVLAINNHLNNGDIVTWMFMEDVCTKTVKTNHSEQ